MLKTKRMPYLNIRDESNGSTYLKRKEIKYHECDFYSCLNIILSI